VYHDVTGAAAPAGAARGPKHLTGADLTK